MKLLFNGTESFKSVPVGEIRLQADKFAIMFMSDPHTVLHPSRRKIQDRDSLSFLVCLLNNQNLLILLADN